jgi:hypothetical protein
MTDAELINFSLTKSNATPIFKLKYFVGGAQLTPYAMLKQWLMELRAREESVDSIRIRLRKSEIAVKQEQEKLEFVASDLQKEIIELEIMDKKNDCVRYQRQLRDYISERDDLIKLIREFCDSEYGRLSDGTPLMEVFGNKELEEKLEHEYWTIRMAKQAALDVMFYGRVNEGNMDAILMMHPEQQKQVLTLATQHAIEIDNGVGLLKEQAMKKLSMISPESREVEPNHYAQNLIEQ